MKESMPKISTHEAEKSYPEQVNELQITLMSRMLHHNPSDAEALDWVVQNAEKFSNLIATNEEVHNHVVRDAVTENDLEELVRALNAGRSE